MKPYYDDGKGIVIYHGDCREVLPKLKWSGVALILTDPPYGVNLTDLHFGKRDASRKVSISNDISQVAGQGVLDAMNAAPTIAFASPKLPWSGEWSQWLVWDKGELVGGGGDVEKEWKRTFELIQVRNLGVLSGKRDGAVLSFPVAPWDSNSHPAEKPIPLLRYLISKVADVGVVLDPFMGSGTTLRAAKDLGRRAIGIEIEERYCEIAAKRLSQQVLDFSGDLAANQLDQELKYSHAEPRERVQSSLLEEMAEGGSPVCG